MKVRIINVQLTARGFQVDYHRVETPGEIRHMILNPGAMPPGHELLRAGVDLDIRFDKWGKCPTSISRPAHLVVVAVGPVLMA